MLGPDTIKPNTYKIAAFLWNYVRRSSQSLIDYSISRISLVGQFYSTYSRGSCSLTSRYSQNKATQDLQIYLP